MAKRRDLSWIESFGTPVVISRTKSLYVPLTWMCVAVVRFGPFCAPLASAPWQRVQELAWNSESPSEMVLAVTPDGRPLMARDAAALPCGAADGDDAVAGPPLWHAALVSTVENTRIVRARELFIRMSEGEV
jgi:hypothetical protein